MAAPKPPPPSPPPLNLNFSSPNTTVVADRPQVSLQPPSQKKGPSKSSKLLGRLRSVFRSFPIITPAACKFPVSLPGHDGHLHCGIRVTGTLFGYRKSRINLAIQENPRSLPMLILELSTPTGKLLQEMGLGLVRIALECEKQGGAEKSKSKSKSNKLLLLEEPIWTMYCNGRKSGYGVKREATADDLNVMKMLHAMSTGAGLLPSHTTQPEGDLTYMRAYFERVTGSKDSETYYMMNPDGNTGPELSIFFVRI